MKIKTSLYFLFIFLVVVSTTSCQAQTTDTPAANVQVTASPEQTISIGIISDDPAGAIEKFQPIADYLAANLAGEDITEGKVVVVANLQGLFKKLETGEIDIFFESPYGATDAYTNAGAIPLLRRWKSGISEYNSLIFVRKDSGITTLDDLKGKMVAFEDSGSTSGYFLPQALLIGEGFRLSEKGEAAGSVSPDEIGYFFTGDSDNSFTLVMRNKIAAAAIQSDDFGDFPQEDRDQLLILAETEFVPRHMAMASPLLSESLRSKIVGLLLGMDESEEGKAVLEATEKTAKFDEFPLGVEATMKALQALFGLGN